MIQYRSTNTQKASKRKTQLNIFLCKVYKAVFNWGNENWCPLDLREHLEYGRRGLGGRELRQ